jgi:hypothetical protein
MWQRLLTACFGLIMIVRAVIRLDVACSAPAARIAHAVIVSDIISLAMVAELAIVSGVLVRRPGKIIAGLAGQCSPGPGARARRVTASRSGGGRRHLP